MLETFWGRLGSVSMADPNLKAPRNEVRRDLRVGYSEQRIQRVERSLSETSVSQATHSAIFDRPIGVLSPVVDNLTLWAVNKRYCIAPKHPYYSTHAPDFQYAISPSSTATES